MSAVQHPSYLYDFTVAVDAWLRQPHALFGMPVWSGHAFPALLLQAAAILVACGIIVTYVALVGIVFIYLERKIAGHIQQRLGPMRVGWHGILQSFADGIKLFAKEDLIPDPANRFLFRFAPAVVFVGALAPFAALPFAQNLVVANMDVGIFYILAFAALEVIGVIMAGWASHSKWSLYGGMRLAAQMVSYEIPLSLSVLTVVLLAGTLNMNAIAMEQQHLAYVFQSPFAFISFFVFYISALASTKRAPFDLPEAESELVSGFHTEYSGLRWSFFMMAEYGAMALMSSVAAILFLGGWNFPFSGVERPVVGLLQLGTKTCALLFVMLWLRWTLPRVRVDQLMHMCLKVLLPLGLFCVLGAGIEAVTRNHLLMWAVVAVLAGWSMWIGRRRHPADFSPAYTSSKTS
jgi:NADH-quinone oxidoreductase subunit H